MKSLLIEAMSKKTVRRIDCTHVAAMLNEPFREIYLKFKQNQTKNVCLHYGNPENKTRNHGRTPSQEAKPLFDLVIQLRLVFSGSQPSF